MLSGEDLVQRDAASVSDVHEPGPSSLPPTQACNGRERGKVANGAAEGCSMSFPKHVFPQQAGFSSPFDKVDDEGGRGGLTSTA